MWDVEWIKLLTQCLSGLLLWTLQSQDITGASLDGIICPL